jgi:Fic family protein
MAKTKTQLLAEALAEVSKSAVGNIVHSKNMNPGQQALLHKNGYLKRIIKGWYLFDVDIAAHGTGESALWYESIWSFIGQYLHSRFKDNYWLSAEASLDIHTDNNSMPSQIVVFVKNGTEQIIKLPNDMSLLLTNGKNVPSEIVEHQDVRVYSLENASASSVPASYKNYPVSMQIALQAANLDKLAEALMRSKNKASAGRIIGAYEALGMRAESKKLHSVLSSVFDGIQIKNPFETAPVEIAARKKEAASAYRVRIIWEKSREVINALCSDKKPGIDFFSKSLDQTLDAVNELYVHDAYHSLSIEGYAVTPDLIERVSRGDDWSPETTEQDQDAMNTLAARGYYDAFNLVKESLSEAYKKEDLSYLIDVGITQWHTALFSPCVTAGLISELDLAGYRKGPIYIRSSRHVPPACEQLMDCMQALKECIAAEESFAVKAILAHWLFGYIHPYFDGNGRTARLLMNFLLIVGGYNWVVVRREDKNEYMAALESASVGKDVSPFANFIMGMAVGG